jgi:SAM-dependent methyltransferase
MDRKRYWDDAYLSYWDELTAQSEHATSARSTAGVAVFERCFALSRPCRGERLLEVGIGFGRLVPSFVAAGLSICGIDISTAMIAEAQRRHGAKIEALAEAEVEALPFAPAAFDLVVCWGVFDACFQHRALPEMARVLDVRGRLLVSGKNDDYHDDDQEAFIAEVNARAKGHPGYFTRFGRLLESLPALGLERIESLAFERRGDLALGRPAAAVPARFYEYLLACRKVGPGTATLPEDLSDSFSRTFRRRCPDRQC